MKYRVTPLILLMLSLALLVSYALPFSARSENNENRTLATFGMILNPEKDSVVYRDSPVERLDAALTDQVAGRETLVNAYLNLFNSSENLVSAIRSALGGETNKEYTLKKIGSYVEIADTGYITQQPAGNPLNPEMIAGHTAQLDLLREKYPELKEYVYFVTQAYDTDWFDAYLGMETADHYEDIKAGLPEEVRSCKMVYQDLEDYMNLHFRTDHHWNHRGAQRGYEDIRAMMEKDFEMGPAVQPAEEINASERYGFGFQGSYAKNLGDLYPDGEEDFLFYRYDLPEYECAVVNQDTLKEKKVVEIGIYDRYAEGNIRTTEGTNHYSKLYGTAVDKKDKTYADTKYVFVIRNSEGNGRNLLICGDSYCRAVRDTLASHFSTTVTMDYRLFDNVPIDTLIEQYGIDTLLLCSNRSLWASESYRFIFGEDK